MHLSLLYSYLSLLYSCCVRDAWGLTYEWLHLTVAAVAEE